MGQKRPLLYLPGGTKVLIATGLAATARLKAAHQQLKEVATALSPTPEEVVAAASDLLAKNKAFKKQLKAATKALMAQQAAQVLASGQQVNEVHIESAGDISVLALLVLKGASEETLLWAKLNGRLYFALISPAGQARDCLARLQALGEGMVAGDGDAKAIGAQGDGDDQPAGGCLIEGTDHDVALPVGRSWFATKLGDRQLVVRQGGFNLVLGGHEGGAGVHQRSAQPDHLALAAILMASHQGLVD